jgi:hypothetical protein
MKGSGVWRRGKVKWGSSLTVEILESYKSVSFRQPYILIFL